MHQFARISRFIVLISLLWLPAQAFAAVNAWRRLPVMLFLLSHVRVGLKPSPSGEGFSMIRLCHGKALP